MLLLSDCRVAARLRAVLRVQPVVCIGKGRPRDTDADGPGDFQTAPLERRLLRALRQLRLHFLAFRDEFADGVHAVLEHLLFFI